MTESELLSIICVYFIQARNGTCATVTPFKERRCRGWKHRQEDCDAYHPGAASSIEQKQGKTLSGVNGNQREKAAAVIAAVF